MPQSLEVVQSDYAIRNTAINLGELQNVLGGHITTRRRPLPPGPLWEGLLGFFEGPLLLGRSERTQSLRADKLDASVRQYTTKLRFTPFALKHEHTTNVEHRLHGLGLTAISAYLSKLGEGIDRHQVWPQLSTPGLRFVYRSDRPLPETGTALDETTLGQPFGVSQTELQFLGDIDAQEGALNQLFFAGRAIVNSQRPLSELPDGLADQATVIAQLTGEQPLAVSAAVHELYGLPAPLLRPAWEAAHQRPTPAAAAQFILGHAE